jgi:formylglycine-generating enzyme required for sulfatase activity
MRPYTIANVDPYVLKPEDERTLKPGKSFRECAKDCPEMVVVPAGEFMMGPPETEKDRYLDEGPLHKVTIAEPFAVAKFDVTFADWGDALRLATMFWAGNKSGHQRELGRSPAVCGVVPQDDGPALPSAHRGGMGIRGSRWQHGGPLLGR